MSFGHCPASFGTAAVILALLLCSTGITVPASAATRYLGDGPAFTATVIGTNEFVPGAETPVRILVRNTGLNSMKQVGVGTIEPEDTQNTAKTVTIGLGSAGDAVIIRTDPQKVGDIRGGSTVTMEFMAKISENATSGEYTLPLNLTYRYPRVMVQEQADVFEFAYNDGETSIPVTLRIESRVMPEVIEAVPEEILSGSEGYLNLTIKNTGPENGTKASVRLLRNGQSPIIPTSSTVFIGDLPSGGTVTCRYKISVAKDAKNQSYPVDLAVTYTNREGEIATSSLTTLGVFVNDRPQFSIVSAVPGLSRGAEGTIEVRYRNDGTVPVYDATARIVPHDPFTSSDTSAYLGDIAPGESAVAGFPVQTGDPAELKRYSLDSTVRYRDAAGTSLESDIVQVPIEVVPAPGGISAIPGGLATIAGCILVLIGTGGYLAYRKKNKSR